MSDLAPPIAQAGQTVVSGPVRAGNEHLWRVRLADGTPAVLGQLLPELAAEESLRRRYVRDVERLRELAPSSVAAVLALGPQPDPRDAAAEPPWRLRADPPGDSFEAWLAARSPAPVDEVLALGARLADALAVVHARGAVVRDLQPTQIVLGDDGTITLTDLGLARLGILSSRTASSLLLEGSPYASPEHLRSTVVDARSDLYALAVMLWRALTGTLPFGNGLALLREHAALPRLHELREQVPPAVSDLLARCLAENPGERPDSATVVAAILRGERTALAQPLARVTCQSCGAPLRVGLRLCLSCGKAGVRFRHVQPGDPRPMAVDLLSIKEEAAYLTPLTELILAVSDTQGSVRFLTGDLRLYAKDEKVGMIKVPARLFDNVTAETATALTERLTRQGIKAVAVSPSGLRRTRNRAIAVMVSSLVGLIATGVLHAGGLALFCLISFCFALFMTVRYSFKARGTGVFTLRAGPALLPAGDPLVARLAALLTDEVRPDVRAQVTELAVLVQRLADHRAEALGSRAEVDMVTEPVAPLVTLLEREVARVTELDHELATLDEGVIVRALAASEARKQPRAQREALLAGLDRMRALEDRRVAASQRLLEVSTLLRRAVELGLKVHDPDTLYRAEIALALAALNDPDA